MSNAEIVGFTGTRHGMTHPQILLVEAFLEDWEPRWVVHGGAPGADLQFHDIAYHLGIRSEVWPAREDLPLWVVETALEVKGVKPPLKRNHDIVDNCDILLATPRTMQEQQRSGTWATIRYARKESRRRVICWPDGSSGC